MAGSPKKTTSLPNIKAEFAAQLAIDRTNIIRRAVPVRAKVAAWAAILGLYVGWLVKK
ncbi:hypothetical protein GCM10010213_26250 [Microbacterium maritypicum]|uniref:Uncharacterized protein n=2 Tax=Microbacterium maritypicum TaxID=33918 RepID=A0A4Y4B820_MICMQ|nr:hypothetical protein MLI01_28230 [Microbacterium liquefaciens]GGV62058.1 hypothetical protein GCM10010213_26250 [Microbacterium liquefaciens]